MVHHLVSNREQEWLNVGHRIGDGDVARITTTTINYMFVACRITLTLIIFNNIIVAAMMIDIEFSLYLSGDDTLVVPFKCTAPIIRYFIFIIVMKIGPIVHSLLV